MSTEIKRCIINVELDPEGVYFVKITPSMFPDIQRALIAYGEENETNIFFHFNE